MAFNKRHIYISALCTYIATVCILCFINPSSLPDAPKDFLGIGLDKIVHFLMFLPFPILTHLALSAKEKFIIIIFLGGCIFAAATEYIQGLTDYRSYDLADLGTDILGLLFGSLITLIYSTLTKRRNNDK